MCSASNWLEVIALTRIASGHPATASYNPTSGRL